MNASGCEGPVLCRRPGPARAPAGTNTGVTPAPASAELPSPRGPSAKVAPALPSRLPPPGPALPVRPALEPHSTHSRRRRSAQGAAPWRLQRSGLDPLPLHGTQPWRPPCLLAQVETTTPNSQCEIAAFYGPMADAKGQNRRVLVWGGVVFCFFI